MMSGTNIYNFATPERMVQIANRAIDYFGERLTGRNLYDSLAATLGLTDEEMLAAGFTTLKEFMEGTDEKATPCGRCG